MVPLPNLPLLHQEFDQAQDILLDLPTEPLELLESLEVLHTEQLELLESLEVLPTEHLEPLEPLPTAPLELLEELPTELDQAVFQAATHHHPTELETLATLPEPSELQAAVLPHPSRLQV